VRAFFIFILFLNLFISALMDTDSLYELYLQHRIISTDTRKIKPGSIFFALKGENFDGNSFALEALRQGASYAIVSDPSLNDPRLIYTEDTLKTIQLLAQFHRRKLNVPVVAITGSNGKTTTKELITAVLSKKYKVHATAGNLNNHIGVPLTLLATPPDVEIIICEMGANHPGEIAALCKIAEPTYGIITNIGKAHLEGFGSIAGVKNAKGELFDYLQHHDGLAFINMDDPNLRELGEKTRNKITYGFDPTAVPHIHFNYIKHEEARGFSLKDKNSNLEIQTTMFGHYNAINMLAAYTVGNYFKVDLKDIVDSLSGFVPGSNRSEVIQFNKCTIVKDAYNANPSSMELAVRSFAERFPYGWVVLGDMKELGTSTNEAHVQMIELVWSFPFKKIILVGDAFSEAISIMGVQDPRITTKPNIEALIDDWDWTNINSTAILLKGSRSMHLERLLDNQT
jgi:UDP-N-acetylmuramoyl-tripeptide--D-alanyl-D-alanine ligase